MSDDLTRTFAEYNDLYSMTKEVDRLLDKAMAEDLAANHLANFKKTIYDELSVVEKQIITSVPKDDYEAVEQIKFLVQIVKQKISDWKFDRDVKGDARTIVKTSELLEIAKAMANVALQF
jgi:hypothetical protein